MPLMAMIRQRRAWPSRSDSVAPVARTAEDVLFSEELHCIEISDPAFVLALAITRETGSRIGLCATDRRHDGPRNSNQASGKADASVRLRV